MFATDAIHAPRNSCTTSGGGGMSSVPTAAAPAQAVNTHNAVVAISIVSFGGTDIECASNNDGGGSRCGGSDQVSVSCEGLSENEPWHGVQRDLPPSRNGNFAAGEALQEQQQQRSIDRKSPPHIRRSPLDPLDRQLAGPVDSLGGR